MWPRLRRTSEPRRHWANESRWRRRAGCAAASARRLAGSLSTEKVMNIGIIGAGNVGSTLGKRWAAKGHAIKFGVRNSADPKLKELLSSAVGTSAGSVAEAAAFGEVVVLSV